MAISDATSDRVHERCPAQVPSLKKKINLVREKLDHPIIASVHEKPSTVLSFLQSNQDSLDDLRKRSETLADYQVALCLLYTSPSPRDQRGSHMPSSA